MRSFFVGNFRNARVREVYQYGFVCEAAGEMQGCDCLPESNKGSPVGRGFAPF